MNQNLIVVWVVLAVAQVVYLIYPAPHREGDAVPSDVFAAALGAVAVVQSIGIVMLLRVRAFNPVRTGRLDPASKSGNVQLFSTLLLAWVLCIGIAMYGLVLRFLHFERAYTLPFALAAACLFLLARPWNAKLKKPSNAADLASSNAPILR